MTNDLALVEERSLDTIANDVRDQMDRGQRGLTDVVESYFAMGHLLTEAKTAVKHGEWYPWLAREFAKTPQWATMLMRGAENESRVRAQIETQVSISEGINFKEAVKGALGKNALTSGPSVDWYTPEPYLEAARDVMGAIDLDPASCEEANQRVRATRYFTKDDDGLKQEWFGRVWMNPPYSLATTGAFVGKMLTEFDAGRVTQAVILLNGYSFDAAWFQPLWDHLLCFTDHRITFIPPGGSPNGGGPRFGNVLVLLGPARDEFTRQFAQFGAVVERRIVT